MTKHWFGPHGSSSKGKGHPIMYSFKEADIYDNFYEGGGFPKRFIYKALETMEIPESKIDEILFMCSGSVKRGITVDINYKNNPKICCDCRNIPLPDNSIEYIICDPPYAESYAQNLYGEGKNYPKPGEILKESARLLKDEGKIGLLHFIVPMVRKPFILKGVYGISTGSGYAIRAWSILQKVDYKYRSFYKLK